LREIHGICPVESVCTTEDGRDPVKRQTHWHIVSGDAVPAMIGRMGADPATYRQAAQERAVFGRMLGQVCLRCGVRPEHEMLPQLYEYALPQIRLMNLFTGGGWQEAAAIFRTNSGDVLVQTSFLRCLYSLSPDRTKDRKVLTGSIRAVLHDTDPKSYSLHWLNPQTIHAAMREKDNELIDTLVRFCHDRDPSFAGACATSIGTYAHGLILAGDYALVRELYRIALTIDRASPDTDLTLYCNALWPLQNDNTGLAADPKLNAWFLEKCLPHAPANPAIYFNAACLYVETGDFDRALECAGLARQYNYDQYAGMIGQFRKERMFREFRKDPRVKKMLQAVPGGVREKGPEGRGSPGR
jgi:hypothetical protein